MCSPEARAWASAEALSLWERPDGSLSCSSPTNGFGSCGDLWGSEESVWMRGTQGWKWTGWNKCLPRDSSCNALTEHLYDGVWRLWQGSLIIHILNFFILRIKQQPAEAAVHFMSSVLKGISPQKLPPNNPRRIDSFLLSCSLYKEIVIVLIKSAGPFNVTLRRTLRSSIWSPSYRPCSQGWAGKSLTIILNSKAATES